VLLDCRINHTRASSQLDEFKLWLDANDEFIERDVVEQLRARLDLCLLIYLAFGRGQPDRYKHELTIQGAFRADLVLGCTTRRHFVLVEFEGGGNGSIFRRGTKQLPDWAPQLQHAFSQVSDWTWAKNDNQKSDLYRNAFGMPHFDETYLVICGRSPFLGPIERSRLHWRSTKTLISACPIHFWTYDDLYIQTFAALDLWRDMQQNP
jgi:hypothetical protein